MGSVRLASALAMALVTAVAAAHGDTVVYSNGFETDATGWTGANRVGTGTGGVSSAAGSFHANASSDSSSKFTNWGGYNYGAGGGVATAFQEYTTSVDVYLNVGGGWANNTRLDFSSAINNSAGNFKRDFIFNAAFHNDATGPGANTNRFVISASNNSQPGSAFAKNPARNPIAISTTGWYTFQHHFYENLGVLAVDMTILDGGNAIVGSWTLSDAADLIAGVGGNRYGWFNYNEFGTNLAFDNAQMSLMTVVPLPSAAWAGLGTLAAVGGLGLIRRRRLQA